MLVLRPPESIYPAHGTIAGGTFDGRWHFSFDRYHDPEHAHFGTLRVFNDDTLSPGATWPLHPHVDNEVVTYVAGGTFRHADEHGEGGVLRQGWVQHTTIGTGMWHSEINESAREPMRFVQMWFIPATRGLPPAVQQRAVDISERTGRFLPLVSDSPDEPGVLPLVSRAAVYSRFLAEDESSERDLRPGYDGYLYVVEGGPIEVLGENGERVQAAALAAVELHGESAVRVRAFADSELLLVEAGEAPG